MLWGRVVAGGGGGGGGAGGRGRNYYENESFEISSL